MNYQIGVASSVSKEQGFDVRDALTYTIEHQFTCFQPFLNEQLLGDKQVRKELRETCKEQHVSLIVHAPATLNTYNLEQSPGHEAVKSLFGVEQAPKLVHHYDETVSFEESLACLKQIQQAGIIACLENYFLVGAQTSEVCFRNYLRLLVSAQEAGLDVLPVFDIPRLYHQRLALSSQRTFELMDEALQVLSRLKTPILLHLIDVQDPAQERSSWCPIGNGLIPYAQIFTHLIQHEIPISHIILEYEDKVNPIASTAFLSKHLGVAQH